MSINVNLFRKLRVALTRAIILFCCSTASGQITMQFAPQSTGKSAETTLPIGTLDGNILLATADKKKETLSIAWHSGDSIKPLLRKEFAHQSWGLENATFVHGHANAHGVQLYFNRTLGSQSEVILCSLTLGLELVGQPKTVLNIAAGNKKNESKFGFDVSPGGEMCLVYKIPDGILDADTPLQMAVVNQQGEKWFEKNLYLPFEKNVFDLNQFKIDDFGTVYMLSGLSMKKNAFASQTGASRNETYVLLAYNHASNKLKEYNIALKDKWVNAASVVIAPNNDAIVAGLFSNTMLPGSAGVFYMRIEQETGAMAASSVSTFDKTLVNSFNEKNSGREMEQLFLDYLYPTPDGGLWLSGEQYYMTERTYLDPTYARPSTIYEYYYGNMLVVGIKPNGEMHYNAVFKKSQVTQNDGGRYSSYFMNATGKAPVLYFFDHPKNTLDMTDRYRMVNAAKSDLVAICLKEGVPFRQNVVAGSRIDLSVKEMLPLPEGATLEFGRLNREDGLMLFQFDKDFWRK